MKNALFLLIAVASLSSCAAKKPVTKTKITKVVLTPPPVHETNDGSSFEKALIITATSESTGISAEYAWLDQKYPGNKRGGQSLTYHDKKPYDVIKVTTTDGKSVDTYFDISNFFGKF